MMGVGVLAPTALAANSLIRGYDKELRMKSILDDIYEQLSGDFLLDRQSFPKDALRLKIDAKAKSESNNITITMVLRLRDFGVYDPNIAIGNEARPITRSLIVRRNIVRKVVTTPGYGVDDLDAKPYGLYKNWVDQLAIWNKEHHGLSIRQAILEQYGESLVHGRTLAACPRNWNPQFLIAGLGRTNMRVNYNVDRAAFTTSIINRILLSGGGSLNPLVTQTLNMPNLSNICLLALERRIAQLNIPGLPGGRGWVQTFSEIQGVYLGDTAWSARNLGSSWADISRLPQPVQQWSGVMGKYKDLLLVQDERQPTLIISGTSAPFGLVAGYMLMGDVDARQRDNLWTRDTSFTLGNGCLIDWTAMPLRHIRQQDDYGMVDGHGTAKVEGVMIPIFGNPEGLVGTAQEQYSSMVTACGLPEYV
jgi:hypothetical protein